MRNIAIYGGAFDPPHIGHIQLVGYLKHIPFIDEIWLLPCGDRQDKLLLFSMKQRFRLMNTLFQQDKSIVISSEEIQMSRQQGKMINTYDLLTNLQKKYEKHCFHFVIGADNLANLKTWGNGVKLFQEFNFILFKRKGYDISNQPFPPKCHFIQNTQITEISSSYLKKVIKDKDLSKEEKIETIQKWLPKKALQFLVDQKIV